MKKEYIRPECKEMGKVVTDTLVSWTGESGDGLFVEQLGRDQGPDPGVGPNNGQFS